MAEPVPDDAIERSPPHSLEGEIAVLGSLLLDNTAIDQMADLLAPADFYRESHSILYRHLADNLTDGREMDILLLKDALKRAGELEKVGGPEYLLKLLDETPTAAHARHYALIVKDLAVRRGIILAGNRFMSEPMNGKPTAAILADCRVTVDDLERESGGSAVRTVAAIDIPSTEIPPMVSLIGPKVLCVGGYMSIAGAPNLGKTYLALDLALRLATGEGGQWLGLAVAPVKVSVLWLWGEGGMAAVKDRLLNLTGGQHLPDNLHFHTPSEMALDLSRPQDAARVRLTLERVKGAAETVLLVVDPQSEWSLHDENKEASLFLRAINGFRNRVRATVLVLNHKRKPQQGAAKGDPTEIRGDSRIHGALDAALMLDREPDGLIRATWGKLRDAPPMDPLLLRLNAGSFEEPGDFRFRVVSSVKERVRGVDRVKQALFDAHEAGVNWLTKHQIRTETGMPLSTIEKHLMKMVKAGMVERDGPEGGAIARYRLIEGWESAS